jgi:hypothetical protein
MALTLRPAMPPLLLISSTARLMPACRPWPETAAVPVSGRVAPIVIWSAVIPGGA